MSLLEAGYILFILPPWYRNITPDYFKGLKRFRKVMPDLPWGSGLIYGGLERQIRSDTRIYSVYDLEDMLNEIKDHPE